MPNIANGYFEFVKTSFTSISRKGSQVSIGFREGWDKKSTDRYIVWDDNDPYLSKFRFNDSKITITWPDNNKMVFNNKTQYNRAKKIINGKVKTIKRKTPTKRRKAPAKKRKAPAKRKAKARKKRPSPSISATSVKAGTRRRGGSGKMYVAKRYTINGKRIQRWVKA